MARLNEPPVSAESHFEILRRKFLRQNRDIAKINSDQSQKIRRLENDCACLLSENLELRGRILRLEKQLEDNSARRVADHALEIKAKLEEQLAEFGALLGNLGMEPPAKRHSPARRFARPRQSTSCRSPRSPPAARRRRDTNVDAETLAAQEGRLPPIYENKSFPRATMNSEEILALCAAAADSSGNSPDIGPPPISRFIEEEPVKHDSPSPVRTTNEDEEMTIPCSPPKLDFSRKPTLNPQTSNDQEAEAMPAKASKSEPEAPRAKPTLIATAPLTAAITQAVRAGTKRKHGDENSNIMKAAGALAQAAKDIENAVDAEKGFPARENQKRRSIKEPTSRKERASGARAPLAAKSTNEDFSSPKKLAQDKPFVQEIQKENKGKMTEKKDPVKKEPAAKEQPARPAKPLPVIEIPLPTHLAPPPKQDSVEPETPLPISLLTSPTTPGRPDAFAQPQPLHDTPPPAHISSAGETSRPSRRARPAISYAEPNLRDKMRRPTKELLDAVSGEGKFHHRNSIAPSLEAPSAPTSVAKPTSSVSKPQSSAPSSAPPPLQTQQAPASPLAQKELPPTVLERRKPGRPSAPSAPVSAHDPYDFASNSSSLLPSSPPPVIPQNSEPSKPTAPARGRTARKSSMAAAAALSKLLDEEDGERDLPRQPKNARKQRASMLAPKKSSMMDYLVDTADEGSSIGDESTGSIGSTTDATKDHKVAVRRRSMML
ncbi:hypothetical protein QBC35DRAFT_490839 [Podospora australis]|uniref:Shugoshin n=1 Tax=Podospora australis TaxID=1536484 RepID=A0AAN6WYT2_9PEZI|nr:hypothetical protein QBC35DRAFT_490839 [Podospora australis]